MFIRSQFQFKQVSILKKTILVLIAGLLLSGCSSSPKYRAHNKPSVRWNVDGESILDSDVGVASFYGAEFAGRATASGEIFNPSALTAAHNSYPFGTKLRVTNLKNNMTVVVVINDRGPHVAGRIIDLSRGAAEKIGMVNDGVSRVRLEVIEWGEEE